MHKGTVNFHRRLVQWLDLPPDVTANVPRIQMIGFYQLVVENHQGLDFFSDSEILLKVGRGKIRIRGENLVIRSIFPEEIRIEGNIAEMIPLSYHHKSLLKFPKKDKIQMDNLVKLFSFTVKFPILKPLVFLLINFKFDKLFTRIDDQYWLTYTHRPYNTIINRNLITETKLFMLFLKRLILPIKKPINANSFDKKE